MHESLGRHSLLPANLKNSWASPTPIVEGDRVYVHFGAEGTAALTTTGEVVWKKQFSYAFDCRAAGWLGRLLAMNTLDGPHLASMAVSGGSLLLRTDSHLYRIGASFGSPW